MTRAEQLAAVHDMLMDSRHGGGTFRDDKQRNAVCRAMLATLHLDHLWTQRGPTEQACELMEARGGYLSRGESTLLLVAFDVYNGTAHTSFDHVLYGLDPKRAAMVGTFLVAFAVGGIDAWIEGADRWKR